MRSIKNWIIVSLINLGLVALLGVTLRFKIAYSLPFVDQRNLLHGHSHFAFSGWISQALMSLLVYYLYKRGVENVLKRYRLVLLLNLITAYGMLISFPIQGYAFVSILFSTLSIFVSYFFAVMYWKDLNRLPVKLNPHPWFKAALLFNVISSVGPFSLAYILANHVMNQKLYLASVYYFLHFQYNGWFLFSCMGFFIYRMNELFGEQKSFNNIFWLFALSCIPSYFLSALWLSISTELYILVVIAALTQLVGWIWLIKIIRSNAAVIKNSFSRPVKWLFSLSAISMTIKLLLQLGSTHPALSQLAFGFRPIVIGYIHLVLLGVITIFLIGYFILKELIVVTKTAAIGLVIFVTGVFLNEIILMVQGSFAMATVSIAHINVYLFIAAIIIFTGILIINISQSGSRKADLTLHNN